MKVCECYKSIVGGRGLLILLAVLAPVVSASDLDVTMRMVDDSEDLTGAVTREIRLPELPALQGHGNDKDAEASEVPGREGSSKARERGRDFGQSVSERAREIRDNKPEWAGDRLPEAAREARDRKPDMPPQSSRP